MAKSTGVLSANQADVGYRAFPKGTLWKKSTAGGQGENKVEV